MYTMSRDHRNLGLVGTTDGVPMFDNKRRGLWPFFLSVANLPHSLSSHMANVHLNLVGASEYHELNKATNTLIRKLHAPKSLKPHLTVIVDDLYHAYHKGIFCTDASIPKGMPGRHFRCRVVLLCWTGDYPGQASSAGMQSKCCHWCEFKGEHLAEVTRTAWADHRRFLGPFCFIFVYTTVICVWNLSTYIHLTIQTPNCAHQRERCVQFVCMCTSC